AFLRHLFHTGDGAFRVLLVIEGDDLDFIIIVADLHTALLVEPVGANLHRTDIGCAPGRRRAAGNTDETDFELLVRGLGGRCGHERKYRNGAKRRSPNNCASRNHFSSPCLALPFSHSAEKEYFKSNTHS